MNKIYHVHFRYRANGEPRSRFIGRAVSAEYPTAAVQRLLGHVRDRPGVCPKCGRDSDVGHGKLRVPDSQPEVWTPCDGKFRSEADAELHGGVTCLLVCEDKPAAQPITLDINNKKFTYDQPGNQTNPDVLR